MPRGQCELEHKQLFERQAPMRRRETSIELSPIRPWLREMHVLNGLLNGQQSIAGTKRNRQHFLRLGDMRVQQAFDEHAHLPGRPPLGFVVHRNNTPHV